MLTNILMLKKNTILGSLIVAQILSYILYIKFDHYAFLGLYFLSSIPLLAALANKSINSKTVFFLLTVLALFIFFSFFSQTNPAYVNLYNLLYGITSLIGAYSLYVLKGPEKFIKFIFWIYTALVYFYIVRFGFSDPDQYNEILAGSSRNYVSGIYLVLISLLALCYEQRKAVVPLIYPVITLIACIFLFGRSGILFAFLITIFVLLRQKNYYILSFLILATIGFIAFKFNEISDFILNKTNFSIGLESERSTILNQYLSNITYSNKDLFLGREISQCCSLIVTLDGNPHNSFIMGHIRYGVIHTIFSVCLLAFIFLSKNITLIFFGLIIFSRFFVDQMGVFTGFDIVLYYLLFLAYNQIQNKGKVGI